MIAANADDVAAAVTARLRGEAVALPDGAVAFARAHAVHLLLAHAMTPGERRSAGLDDDWRAAAVVESWRRRQSRAVIDVLAGAGVRTLLLKGAALAQTHYAMPFLRPRSDLDVLVAEADIDTADRTLGQSGWSRAVEPPATFSSAQRHYRHTEGDLAEQLDLHWAIANAQVFAPAARFDVLARRAVAVPSLGPHAAAPDAVDALFIACVHRVAHHFDADRLIWLWDIHVLASSLSPDARARFVSLARQARMRSVCARGLDRAAAAFHTHVDDLIGALDPDGDAAEPSASFLKGGRTVDVLASDLRHAGGWRLRSRLLREHLFPPRAYMGARYPGWPSALLPFAYAYRIARGAPAWFRR